MKKTTEFENELMGIEDVAALGQRYDGSPRKRALPVEQTMNLDTWTTRNDVPPPPPFLSGELTFLKRSDTFRFVVALLTVQ